MSTSLSADRHVLRSGTYRPEIEGLRTVAFILVAIFHIWFNRVSGGVDVFFTVAGFLIAVTLLGQIRRDGRVRAGRFFGRLALRLLPTVSVVLLAVLVLTVLITPFAEWRDVFQQVIASVTYWENWYLAFNAVDYLAIDTSRSPVQHFWAISIQGQFYILWFVAFGVSAWIAQRRGQSVRHVALVVFSLAIAASLVWSVYQTHTDQQFAYFSTLTRVWEFGLGGVLALVVDRIRLNRTFAAILSWISLATIVSIGVLLPVADSFPGYVALIPVVAACTIIATGQQEARWGASAVLASKPLVWLGGLGYGVYLWHWPVLIFALEVRNHAQAGPLTGAAVLVVSVALAWLTKRLVETPVLRWRDSGAVRVRRTAFAGVAICTLIVVTGAGIGLVRVDSQIAQEQEMLAHPCLGANILDDMRNCDVASLDGAVVPSNPSTDSALIFRGKDSAGRRCATGMTSSAFSPCVFGNANSDTKIALIGNSHAAVWFPAYREIAERNDWRLDSFFKNSCTFNSASRSQPQDIWRTTCDEWNIKLSEYMADAGPYDYVLTSSIALNNSFIGTDGKISMQAGVDGYKDVWQPLIDDGATILAVRDYPRATKDVLDCARENPDAICERPRDDAVVEFDNEAIAVAASELDGAEVIDMNDWFCIDDVCPAVIGNVQVYRDVSHFTNTYGLTLTDALLREIRKQAGIDLK